MSSEIQLFDRRCINLHLELGRAKLVVVRCGTVFCYEAEWWRWRKGIRGLDRVECVVSWDWDCDSGGCMYCLRTHLLIWTVFLPKFLFQAMWMGLHIFVEVVVAGIL